MPDHDTRSDLTDASDRLLWQTIGEHSMGLKTLMDRQGAVEATLAHVETSLRQIDEKQSLEARRIDHLTLILDQITERLTGLSATVQPLSVFVATYRSNEENHRKAEVHRTRMISALTTRMGMLFIPLLLILITHMASYLVIPRPWDLVLGGASLVVSLVVIVIWIVRGPLEGTDS